MKLKFITIFVLLILITFLTLSYTKEQNIKHILDSKSKEFNTLYNAIYNQYKEESKLIFKTIINKEKIINIYKNIQDANEDTKATQRRLLYDYIKEDYKALEFISIRQLHFHLKNNESFLRMHRPNKFGDNLTSVRPTVVFVNQTHKPIDGFEEGRIFNGFRFVFPISDKNTHLGSVEISFSADAIISKFKSEYQKNSNLHISQKVVDEKLFKDEKSNYVKSTFDGFLIDKEVFKKINNIEFNSTRPIPNDTTQNIVLENIKNNTSTVSIYDATLKKIITILPIQNPITKQTVAFISSKSDSIDMGKTTKYFNFLLLLTILLITIILLYLYRQLKYKEELQNSLKEQAKIILKEQEANKEKERMLFQQSKMASMGEMIENIAHQWRQPLSVISTYASGVQLNKEYKILTDDFLDDSLMNILNITEHLSKTIDDFRNYFKEDKNKELLNINDTLNKTLFLISSKFHNDYITIIRDTKDITYYGLENELIQVLMVIFNNAKDALEDIEDDNKLIFISTQVVNNQLEISIKDNAGGIPKDIIDKIFEPYFTTKHKSQGTGIGLFMAQKMMIKHMDGHIKVKSVEFDYKDKKYVGAEFTITLLIS